MVSISPPFFGGKIVLKLPGFFILPQFFDQCISPMILRLAKILRQFWNADYEYFPMVTISLPLIADFGKSHH